MGRVASALHCISPSGASTSPTYPTLDPLAMAAKKGLLERLAQGPVIGDGGFVFALKPYLMCQPLAFHTPDAGKQGFIDLPEFPFGLEPRICTRWDMHRF